MSDQQLRAETATEDWKYQCKIQRERAHLLEQENAKLVDRLAESHVNYRESISETGDVRRDRDEREHQRKIANDALEMAIKVIAAGHAKAAPTHKSGEARSSTNCKTCIQIRTLNRQLVRSARPESRLALAS